MEHRHSVRIATVYNFLIRKAGVPVAIGRTLNSSNIGFFINTLFSDVNIEQTLDLELLPATDEEKYCRFSCNVRVIRKTKLGLGVEIEFTNAEIMNSVSAISTKFSISREFPTIIAYQ